MEWLPGLYNAENLHPMFVHFPIALTLTALLSEFALKVTKREIYGSMAGILLNLAALSAVVTIVTGFWASGILGHDTPGHEYVHVHRNIMLLFTGLIVFSAVLFQFLKVLNKRSYRLIVLLILSGILVVGADRGANLVFQHGIGIKHPTAAPKSESDGQDDNHSSGMIDHGKKVHSDVNTHKR